MGGEGGGQRRRGGEEREGRGGEEKERGGGERGGEETGGVGHMGISISKPIYTGYSVLPRPVKSGAPSTLL